MTVIAIGVSLVASYFDSKNTDGDFTVGVRANYNENGEYSGTDVYGGFGDQHIYCNNSPGKENWVRIIKNDARGIESVYPEMYLLGPYAGNLTSRGFSMTGGKFGVHGAHHTFPYIGRSGHSQLNTWWKGIPNSHSTIRVPIPRYFTPAKVYNRILWK